MAKPAGKWTLLAVQGASCYVASPNQEVLWLQDVNNGKALRGDWNLDDAFSRGYRDVRHLNFTANGLLKIKDLIAAALQLQQIQLIEAQQSDRETPEEDDITHLQYMSNWVPISVAIRENPQIAKQLQRREVIP